MHNNTQYTECTTLSKDGVRKVNIQGTQYTEMKTNPKKRATDNFHRLITKACTAHFFHECAVQICQSQM